MNKAKFIEMVADKAEMSRTAAARAVDAIFNTANGAITEAVDAAGHLSIPGFGKFKRRTRAARTGRNPRTGRVIDIPERTSIGFTPGRGLRNLAGADGQSKPAAKKTAAKKSTTAKKTTAKSTAAAKSTTKKSTATKSAPTKSMATKSTAKKSAGATKKAGGAARAQKSK